MRRSGVSVQGCASRPRAGLGTAQGTSGSAPLGRWGCAVGGSHRDPSCCPPPQPSGVTWGLAMRVLAAPCLLAYALLNRDVAAELTPPGLAPQGFRHTAQAGKHQLPTQPSWVLTQQGGRLRARTGSWCGPSVGTGARVPPPCTWAGSHLRACTLLRDSRTAGLLRAPCLPPSSPPPAPHEH